MNSNNNQKQASSRRSRLSLNSKDKLNAGSNQNINNTAAELIEGTNNSPTKRKFSLNNAAYYEQDKLKNAKLNEILFKIKLKYQAQKFLACLPSRIFSRLTMEHYSLIGDQASFLLNQQSHSTTTAGSITQNQSQQSPLQRQSSSSPRKSKQAQVTPLIKVISSEFSENQQQQNFSIKNNDNNKVSLFIIAFAIVTKGCKLLQFYMQKVPVFNPSSNYKLIWDFIQLFLTITFVFFIPINIIYNLSFEQLMGQWLSSIGPILFILDNIFYLNMGIYNKGVLISDRWRILKYWLHNMLFVDFVSIFPLSIYVYINYDFSAYLREYRFILLLFSFKIGRLMKIINKLQEQYTLTIKQNNLIALIKLLCFAVMMGHMFASINLYFANILQKQGYSSWLNTKNLHDETWQIQYLYSFYYAAVTMLTIGYGDITPQSYQEVILTIVLMFISCGVFGYTLNSINQIFEGLYKQENEKKKKLLLINNYMKKKNVSKDLQYQIREYLDYVWRMSSEDAEDEEKIMGQLNDILREKLLMDANKIVLKDSSIFKNNFSEQVIQKTAALITEYKCVPEEIIFLDGDKDDCSIFYIEKGSVEIFMDIKIKGSQTLQSKTLQCLDKGQSFGYESFFTGQNRNFNMKSTEFTTLLMIKRQDFLQLLADYPEDYERFTFIKDSLCINKSYKSVSAGCHSCKKCDHNITACSMLHLVVQRERLVIQNNLKQMERSQYDRQKNRIEKFGTLKKAIDLADGIINYQEENESDLDDYEIKHGLDFDNSLTSGDSDNSLSDEEFSNELTNINNNSRISGITNTNSNSNNNNLDGKKFSFCATQQFGLGDRQASSEGDEDKNHSDINSLSPQRSRGQTRQATLIKSNIGEIKEEKEDSSSSSQSSSSPGSNNINKRKQQRGRLKRGGSSGVESKKSKKSKSSSQSSSSSSKSVSSSNSSPESKKKQKQTNNNNEEKRLANHNIEGQSEEVNNNAQPNNGKSQFFKQNTHESSSLDSDKSYTQPRMKLDQIQEERNEESFSQVFSRISMSISHSKIQASKRTSLQGNNSSSNINNNTTIVQGRDVQAEGENSFFNNFIIQKKSIEDISDGGTPLSKLLKPLQQEYAQRKSIELSIDRRSSGLFPIIEQKQFQGFDEANGQQAETRKNTLIMDQSKKKKNKKEIESSGKSENQIKCEQCEKLGQSGKCQKCENFVKQENTEKSEKSEKSEKFSPSSSPSSQHSGEKLNEEQSRGKREQSLALTKQQSELTQTTSPSPQQKQMKSKIEIISSKLKHFTSQEIADNKKVEVKDNPESIASKKEGEEEEEKQDLQEKQGEQELKEDNKDEEEENEYEKKRQANIQALRVNLQETQFIKEADKASQEQLDLNNGEQKLRIPLIDGNIAASSYGGGSCLDSDRSHETNNTPANIVRRRGSRQRSIKFSDEVQQPLAKDPSLFSKNSNILNSPQQNLLNVPTNSNISRRSSIRKGSLINPQQNSILKKTSEINVKKQLPYSHTPKHSPSDISHFNSNAPEQQQQQQQQQQQPVQVRSSRKQSILMQAQPTPQQGLSDFSSYVNYQQQQTPFNRASIRKQSIRAGGLNSGEDTPNFSAFKRRTSIRKSSVLGMGLNRQPMQQVPPVLGMPSLSQQQGSPKMAPVQLTPELTPAKQPQGALNDGSSTPIVLVNNQRRKSQMMDQLRSLKQLQQQQQDLQQQVIQMSQKQTQQSSPPQPEVVGNLFLQVPSQNMTQRSIRRLSNQTNNNNLGYNVRLMQAHNSFMQQQLLMTQFDQMKQFQVYFPHNNLENVLKVLSNLVMKKKRMHLKYYNQKRKSQSGRNSLLGPFAKQLRSKQNSLNVSEQVAGSFKPFTQSSNNINLLSPSGRISKQGSEVSNFSPVENFPQNDNSTAHLRNRSQQLIPSESFEDNKEQINKSKNSIKRASIDSQMIQ